MVFDYQWSKWNCFKPILATKPFSLNVDFLLNVLLVMIRGYQNGSNPFFWQNFMMTS